MPKVITIEQLARLCQREFTAIRKDRMEADGELRADLRSGFEGLERKWDTLGEVLSLIHADLKFLKKNSANVDDLLIRIQRIEKKIGIRN